MAETKKIYHGMNIMQRIHAAQGEITYMQKEKKEGMRYAIVSHDKVTAKVRPVLHKWGVIYALVAGNHSQDGNRCELEGTVRFMSIDDHSDCFDTFSLGYGVDPQDKAPGKAMSYAVKYALLKTLGLETGDDPDLDQETLHNSAEYEEFESSIEAAEDLDHLDEVQKDLKAASARLQKQNPAGLQILRQKFTDRKRDLTPQS